MTEPPDLLATALRDRYTLQRELGCGGMAVVYLAHDVRGMRGFLEFCSAIAALYGTIADRHVHLLLRPPGETARGPSPAAARHSGERNRRSCQCRGGV
jgi:serine/threonine protein kinase